MSDVRIIAGRWRRRKISFPQALGIRPTHDRIRETLFNWLAPTIDNAICLDLFSGSGILGIEALSRNAKAVTFVDDKKDIILAIKKNMATLSEASCEFIYADFKKALLQSKNKPFDIVFLDPPYRQGLLEDAISRLESDLYLKPNALIYIEFEKDLSLSLPKRWHLLKQKRTASLECRLYQRSL